MSNLAGSPNWSDVYELETSDPVLGGPGAMDNRQAQALLERTEWLKTWYGVQSRFKDKAVITSNTTIDNSYVGKIIQIVATDNITITISQQRNFAALSMLHFTVVCVPGKTVTIQPSSGEQIQFGSDQENELHLIDGEFLKLITNSILSGSTETGLFIVEDCSDSLYLVGEEVRAMWALKNTHARDGAEVSRADYARIWKYIQRNLTPGQSLVTAAVWATAVNIGTTGNPIWVYPYKGCYSTGDGSTTFQFPDDRGLFERNFDGGRGMDSGIVWNYPGGYEHDGVGVINAKVTGKLIKKGGQDNGLVVLDVSAIGGTTADAQFGNKQVIVALDGQANDTRPRSNAKLPLVRL